MHRLGIGIVATGLLIVLSIFCSVSFAQDQGKALIEAAKQGDLEQVRELLNKRADVNARNINRMTALMSAAMKRNLDVVKFLIEKGSDVNARTDRGMTALMFAAAEGKLEAVKLLIEKGTDPSAKDKSG
jgi:uncharacterized protein